MIKTAFVTCVKIGLSCIEEIYNIGGKLELLITLKDDKAKKKSGRIYLDNISETYNIPLKKINNINDKEVIDILKKYKIDWLFIIGWSQIAHKELLDTPKKGCIGMHPTLLPIGRGRASIPWAIIKGLDKTGVTMFKLDEGVDTGDIIDRIEIPLNKTITATELYQKVNDTHMELIRKTWNNLLEDKIMLIKQDDSFATEWPGRKPSDGEITKDMDVNKALTLIRATTKPYPGAFIIKGNKKITIWAADSSTDTRDFKLLNGYIKLIDFEVINYE